jgi:CRAL/TRIO domain
VFNLRKLFESKIDLQTCIKSNHYLLEYLKSEVLVPGRIETWDFIVDLEGFNKLKYPKSSFEKIFKEFTRFYPSRANLIITINSDNLHKLIKKAYLLFKSTSEYYSRVYCGDDYKRTLLKYIPKKNLEIKYGGLCPNLLTNFFPPSY